MNYKLDTVLIDLDGTLLPMDQEEFTKEYFKGLIGACGNTFDAKLLTSAVWAGTKAMVKNDGAQLNRHRFWSELTSLLGEGAKALPAATDRFYEADFHLLKGVTGENPFAAPCVRALKKKGYKVVLATNPIFPTAATHARMSWVGLAPQDFDLITSYDNWSFAKPNLRYYSSILEALAKAPCQCIMAGNDAREDMIAARLGLDVFFVTDNPIYGEGQDLHNVKKGSFEEFSQFVEALPPVG